MSTGNQACFGSVTYSIVIPVYNESAVLPALHKRLADTAARLDGSAEFLFVDDGSVDESFSILAALRDRDPRVRLMRLSRNFGHQAAVTAGLDYALGEAVVVIDADLQDPPELIVDLARRWREGYEVVYAIRHAREGESHLKRWTASAYYRVMSRVANVEIPIDVGDCRLIGRHALDALRKMKEHHRFIRGMVSWVGFAQTGVPYVREARYAGKSKYPFRKMLSLAIDGITSFSCLPLRLATYVGLTAAMLSLGLVGWVFYMALAVRTTVPGWASMMVVVLFLGGVQLFSLGILGEYLGRVYDEVRQRPLYILDEQRPAEELVGRPAPHANSGR